MKKILIDFMEITAEHILTGTLFNLLG